jgi:hypothetical protein
MNYEKTVHGKTVISCSRDNIRRPGGIARSPAAPAQNKTVSSSGFFLEKQRTEYEKNMKKELVFLPFILILLSPLAEASFIIQPPEAPIELVAGATITQNLTFRYTGGNPYRLPSPPSSSQMTQGSP